MGHTRPQKIFRKFKAGRERGPKLPEMAKFDPVATPLAPEQQFYGSEDPYGQQGCCM
jgi:hypothetical protein